MVGDMDTTVTPVPTREAESGRLAALRALDPDKNLNT